MFSTRMNIATLTGKKTFRVHSKTVLKQNRCDF